MTSTATGGTLGSSSLSGRPFGSLPTWRCSLCTEKRNNEEGLHWYSFDNITIPRRRSVGSVKLQNTGMNSSHSAKVHTSYIYVYTLISHRMVSCVLHSLGSPLFLNVDAIITLFIALFMPSPRNRRRLRSIHSTLRCLRRLL